VCGISGFFGPRDPALLHAMTDAQRHRGPDDDGYLETDAASLGFRRLSIIDVAHGQQPIAVDDGRLQIVYNGEVYNFRELRVELEALGHRFDTHCDTEVVLHAYQEWGVASFPRLNGMWGLALLDSRGPRPRLILCRDHFGIKPLHFARSGGRVLFASEIKAILQDPAFERRVDEQSMYEYLAHGAFDHKSHATFFTGISQVPAASYVVVDDGGIDTTTYWTPVLDESGSPEPAAFREVFDRAVARRLVSDVPVGICLSGGLDSSSICGVMARQLADHLPDAASLGDRLKTFSAVFPGDPIDETRYIDAVLRRTGADNARVEPTSEDFLRELEAWVWHVEQPMVSSAPFAMWMVTRRAAEDVTVVLDGQGGDELLAGYDHYPYVYVRQLFHERRWRDFAREAWRSRDIYGPLARRRLRDRRLNVDVRPMLQRAFTSGRRGPVDDREQNHLKRRLLQDFLVWSLPPLLRYEDRCSMAHSLEARLPFLDQELVDYVLRLPADAIIRNGWNRRVLRDGLRDVLPDIVARRRKKIGFTTPEFRWYRRQRAALQSLLRSPRFTSRPYWHAAQVAEGFRAACAGESTESMFFWRVINAEIWLRIFFDDSAVALDGSSYSAGFARRGDEMVARSSEDARRIHDSCRPTFGRHLFLQLPDGRIVARVPLRSKVLVGGDDLHAEIHRLLAELRDRGVALRDGDVLLVSEKALAITQGRSLPVDEVNVRPLARVLSRFVSRVPTGIGIGHPATMQLAIEEAGVPRILLAAVAAAATRPFGVRGMFYRVAGSGVNAIDGPSHLNLPPYDRYAIKGPEDPHGAAAGLAAQLSAEFACTVSVAVIDASDLTATVLGSSEGVDRDTVLGSVADNPLGQTDEATPFGLLREIHPGADRGAAVTAAASAAGR
jgi:asparagine synthase (glutamine-hydrolysing)